MGVDDRCEEEEDYSHRWTTLAVCGILVESYTCTEEEERVTCKNCLKRLNTADRMEDV